MTRGILIAGGLLLLAAAVLAFAPTAALYAAPAVQAAVTPGAAPVPTNLVGTGPNYAVGNFLPWFLIIGLIFAGVGAFLAARRDTQKAESMHGPDAPHVH